ncbi:M61 family metallopeptidase [Flavobacteriaceae bacterium M23B6Z8]
MKKILCCLAFFAIQLNSAQKESVYSISFENAVHHEAKIEMAFFDLEQDTITLRMSRTSPGRYALHEFAKNVYDLKVVDGKGNSLKVRKPDPYHWEITGHDGSLQVSYKLYANHADGTYSQIDETHAHLNMPATFMYVPSLHKRPIRIQFKTREDLNWKVATQLKPEKDDFYFAPDLDYFMDSPTEISDFEQRSFVETSNGKEYTIHLVLHHSGTTEEFDTYFDMVKAIVAQEKAVFGALPDFDYGNYYFLGCYLPHVDGDGMEHRNSTILTSTLPLGEGGMEQNIGTVSHEFFHAWNVERIRPASLQPFDYEAANMSGALWFAEGFTSYYTGLILCRAGIISPEAYIEGLSRTFKYVWNSPGRAFFNPVEMSYQAPFVDAATSVDDVNRENTFISYYSYGSMLGLALDLSLRQMDKKLHLDDYMKLVWNKYGKNEIPFTLKDLQSALNQYAGSEFGDHFFNNYIYKSEMPDYEKLFKEVGVLVTQETEKAFSGLTVEELSGRLVISENTQINSPAYKANLEKGDLILKINSTEVFTIDELDESLRMHQPKDTISIDFSRFGKDRNTTLILESDPSYKIYFQEVTGKPLSEEVKSNRDSWLKPR